MANKVKTNKNNRKDVSIMKDMNFFGSAEPVQESYNAGSSSYRDLFDAKFNAFDPANIVTGNNSLKSGQFAIEVEEGPNKIGYKNNGPAMTPKPGKFF